MKLTTLDGLRAWLDRLMEAESTDVIAPCDVDGHVLYRPVASSEEVLFDYERPELSAKDYLLPATEIILRVERRGKDVELEEVLPDRQQVLFGIRPCDAHGFLALDALFLDEEPVDEIYRHHREPAHATTRPPSGPTPGR